MWWSLGTQICDSVSNVHVEKVNKAHKYMLIISGILRCNDTIEFPTIEYDVCCVCAQIGFRQCPAHPSADDSSFTIQSENEIEIR